MCIRDRNEVVEVGGGEVPARGAHDSDGHRMVEAVRVTQRHDPLSRFDGVGVAQRRHWKVLFGGDLDQGEVVATVTAYDLSVEGATVEQRHADRIGAVDD